MEEVCLSWDNHAKRKSKLVTQGGLEEESQNIQQENQGLPGRPC